MNNNDESSTLHFKLNVKHDSIDSTLGSGIFSETTCISKLNDDSKPQPDTPGINKDQRFRNIQDLKFTREKSYSIIAHDLKNPFNAILGFLEVLKENLDDLDKKTVESYINHIYNSANRAYHLLETLLEWSLLQNQERGFNPVKVQLHELINEEIENVNYLALPKQITISHTIPAGLTVVGDKQMIKTIVRNLLDNAVKFTHQEGEVSISSERLKDYVEIVVKDNGIGMLPERRERLLQGCIHQTTPGTNNEKGTGLGLLLCKEFTEIHGGIFDIESIPCQGSKFKFTIPC